MPTISVIVPVYKTEKFLDKCVNSILSQSFTDFELILVDDCSPDNSGKKCDEYQDERIKVIHLPQNGGLSNARNVGMEQAKGDYFVFVDSDDYVEPKMLETAYNKAILTNADIVLYGFNSVVEIDGEVKLTTKSNCKPCVLKTKKEISSVVLDLKKNALIDSSWNKLYKSKVVIDSGVTMPLGETFEDTEFNLRLLPYINTLAILEECFYNYMQRNNSSSITKSYDKNKLIFLKIRSQTLVDYFNKVGFLDDEKITACNYFYIKYAFSCFIDLHFPAAKLSSKQRREFISDELKSNEFKSAMQSCASEGIIDKMVVISARTKNPVIIDITSGLMYIIKFKMQKLFFKMKAKNI